MRDRVDVDVAGEFDNRLTGAASGDEAFEAAPAAGAENELGGVLGTRELHQGGGDVIADHGVVAAAEVLDQPPLPDQRSVRGARSEPVAARDVDGEQVTAYRPVGDAGGPPDEGAALGAAGQRDHDPLPNLPDPTDAVLGAVRLKRLVDAVGHPQQGELTQRRQISGSEVVGERRVDLRGRIDVAVRHPAAQPFGRHVHQLDLMGSADDLIGHRLVLRHPGDLLDDVVEGFEVLDVERADDIDPCCEQLLDVLPALEVAAAARDVAVGELVDNRDLRAAREDRGEVHLRELAAVVRARGSLDDFQAVEHRLRAGAPVALDEPHDDIGAACRPAPRLIEHAVGLAHPRGGPEVDLQTSGTYITATGPYLTRAGPCATHVGPYVTHCSRRAPLTGVQLPGGKGSFPPTEALVRVARRAP